MITYYNSSISEDDKYSHLSSDLADLKCTNCNTTKVQNDVKPQFNQTRTIADYESGEIICSICGMVISDKIQSNGPEWHNFEQSGIIIGNSAETSSLGKRRVSTSSLARHDKGLYTVIGERDSDAYGRQLDPLVRHSMHKLRMYDVRTQTTFRDRNRRRAFIELYKLKDKIGLSDAIIEKTAYIYRKAEKRGIIKGRTIPSILAASLYMACREMTVPKTLKEIAKASNIRLKTLSKDYRLLLTELDLKVPNNDLMYYVFKIGNALPTSEKTKRRAIELGDILNKKDRNTYTSGKDPMGLAATVLFVASANNGENMTQREIATAAGLTTVTIRCRLKEISKYLESFDNQE
ncbi:MAG: TFIIB-type zinc ribbon-containing protein [Nitrososphaeraceae archaeon]